MFKQARLITLATITLALLFVPTLQTFEALNEAQAYVINLVRSEIRITEQVEARELRSAGGGRGGGGRSGSGSSYRGYSSSYSVYSGYGYSYGVYGSYSYGTGYGDVAATPPCITPECAKKKKMVIIVVCSILGGCILFVTILLIALRSRRPKGSEHHVVAVQETHVEVGVNESHDSHHSDIYGTAGDQRYAVDFNKPPEEPIKIQSYVPVSNY